MKTITSIAESFGAAATTYAAHCDAQKKAAMHLASMLQDIKSIIPQGTILEIGCGTGVFTEALIELMPERELLVTDISAAMVNQCRQSVGEKAQFATQDAEQINVENKYALIVCAFAAQWFSDFGKTLDRLFDALIPGGYILISVPTDESFPEWREVALKVNTEYSGNALPPVKALESYFELKGKQRKYEVQHLHTFYSSSLHFFKALKGLGASVRITEPKRGQASLRSLIRHWDEKSGNSVCATYEVFFGAIQK